VEPILKENENRTQAIDRARVNYTKNLKTQADFEALIYKKTEQSLNNLVKAENNKIREQVKNLQTLGQLRESDAKQINALLDQEGGKQKAVAALVKAVAEQRIESLKNQANATITETNKVLANNQAFNDAQKEASKKLAEALTSDIEKIGSAYVELFDIQKSVSNRIQGILGIRFKKTLTEEEKLAAAEKRLAELRLNSEDFTQEQKLRIYEATNEAIIDSTRETTAEISKQIEKFIGLAQNALNAYQEYVTRSEELALERLERQETEAMRQLEFAYAQGLVAEKTYQEKKTELTEEYAAQRAAIEKKYRIQQLRLDRVQAIANVALGVSRAIGEGGVAGLITGLIVAAAGAAEVSIINQQLSDAQALKRGGMIRAQQGLLVDGPSHEYGGVKFQNGGYELEGGEAVINRVSSRNYQGLLSQINQMGGGRPLVASFDDSRIVDAIAKQKMEPIRAYVVQQEITDAQNVSKRLEQLSRF
jgi:hypothetical protein